MANVKQGGLFITFATGEQIQSNWRRLVFQKDEYIQLTPVSRSDVPAEEGVMYLDKDDSHLYINITGAWKLIV